LHRFGCRVLGYDTRTITSLAGVEQVSLEQLFRSANVITLHLPGTPDTERIINAASLQSMRDDVVIINTARGELVDEQALFDFLSTHKKAFACLDTFWEEPYKGPLLTLPNTLLTSHIGSFARESRIAMEQEAVRNLLDRLR
jgi:D-3-phosphoglycerate dehydrogenase